MNLDITAFECCFNFNHLVCWLFESLKYYSLNQNLLRSVLICLNKNILIRILKLLLIVSYPNMQKWRGICDVETNGLFKEMILTQEVLPAAAFLT